MTTQSNRAHYTNDLNHSIREWYEIARNNRLYRFNYNSRSVEDLQLRVDRDGSISIVLIQLNEELRGGGRFGRFIAALQTIAQVNVNCPQPRLRAYCERHNIPVT